MAKLLETAGEIRPIARHGEEARLLVRIRCVLGKPCTIDGVAAQFVRAAQTIPRYLYAPAEERLPQEMVPEGPR
jgi:hypothetical protein